MILAAGAALLLLGSVTDAQQDGSGQISFWQLGAAQAGVVACGA
jgi:hypothetical protein